MDTVKDQTASSDFPTQGKHVTNLSSQIHSEGAPFTRRLHGLMSNNTQKVMLFMAQDKIKERQQGFAAQEQKRRRYVTPKNEGKVFIQVPVEKDLREKVNALARAKNTGTQDFIAGILASEVEKNDRLVTKGKQLIAEGHVKPYRTKLQILEEELARYKKLSPSR